MKHLCSSGLFLCSGCAMLNARSCSFSCALRLCLREFYYKGRCTGKIQRGKHWHSQKEWLSTRCRSIIFSADHTSHPCSFMTVCYNAQCVRLTCNGFVSSVWVFRFPFRIFVKPNFKPVFYFACTKKKASACVNIVLNQYSGACLKVWVFFLFWIRVASDFLQMARVLISVTSRCSKTCCSIFVFHTSY